MKIYPRLYTLLLLSVPALAASGQDDINRKFEQLVGNCGDLFNTAKAGLGNKSAEEKKGASNFDFDLKSLNADFEKTEKLKSDLKTQYLTLTNFTLNAFNRSKKELNTAQSTVQKREQRVRDIWSPGTSFGLLTDRQKAEVRALENANRLDGPYLTQAEKRNLKASYEIGERFVKLAFAQRHANLTKEAAESLNQAVAFFGDLIPDTSDIHMIYARQDIVKIIQKHLTPLALDLADENNDLEKIRSIFTDRIVNRNSDVREPEDQTELTDSQKKQISDKTILAQINRVDNYVASRVKDPFKPGESKDGIPYQLNKSKIALTRAIRAADLVSKKAYGQYQLRLQSETVDHYDLQADYFLAYYLTASQMRDELQLRLSQMQLDAEMRRAVDDGKFEAGLTSLWLSKSNPTSQDDLEMDSAPKILDWEAGIDLLSMRKVDFIQRGLGGVARLQALSKDEIPAEIHYQLYLLSKEKENVLQISEAKPRATPSQQYKIDRVLIEKILAKLSSDRSANRSNESLPANIYYNPTPAEVYTIRNASETKQLEEIQQMPMVRALQKIGYALISAPGASGRIDPNPLKFRKGN